MHQGAEMPTTNPMGLFFLIPIGIFSLLMIASLWVIFTKAGQPGWAAIIPIYNVYIMLKIAGKPGWWLLLMLIPFVNFIIAILIAIGISENFGKKIEFAIGMILLPFIFYPILAFGDAKYSLKARLTN
jgi:hypothetical protein